MAKKETAATAATTQAPPVPEIPTEKGTDVSILFDAVKELTSEVGKLKSEVRELRLEQEKWRKAGRF